MGLSLLDMACNLGPCILGLLANLWLFGRFLLPQPKTTGFLMVSILAVPNCIFNLLSIANIFTSYYFDVSYYTVFLFSLTFSNFWASCMTYLIYKSIRNTEFDVRSNLCKALTTILLVSILTSL